MATIRVIRKNAIIYLKVSVRGRVTLHSLEFKVPEKFFETKKELVKSTYPNANTLNKLIAEAKLKANNKLIEFQSQGVAFTSKTLIEAAFQKQVNTYYDFMEQYIKNLALNTKRIHLTAFNKLSGFLGKDFLPAMVTESALIKLVNQCRANGNSDSSINLWLGSIVAILRFSGLQNPLSSYTKNKVLKIKRDFKHKALSKEDIYKIYNWYVSRVVGYDEDGELCIKDLTKFSAKPFSKEAAVCCFLGSYIFQGLSPVDLFKLKVIDLQDKETYFLVETKRQKTYIPVRIVISKTFENLTILQPLLSTACHRSDYLFPVYRGDEKTEKNFISRRLIKLESISKAISEILGFHTTMYSARHSYASALLNNGINLSSIATALGRTATNIGTYLKDFTKDEEQLNVNRVAEI